MNTPFPYRVGDRLLTIEGLAVSYETPVLCGVEASIDNIIRDGMHQGQVVCLLGPSGIGKTQLFRCIAGLQAPNAGGVYLNGKRASVAPGEVGVVAQHYPLLGHRTVLGNLVVAAMRKGDGRAAAIARAMQMLGQLGLAERALAYPAQLSGGQRQRVAIAQQLLCSSHFLLMDEPFSGLDPAAKATVCETIRNLSTADELNTIIVVTHDIDSALRIADTLWVLGRVHDEAGKVVGGARIVDKIDLIARGLAWHTDVDATTEFQELSKSLSARFASL
jgi:ABC-type nitrate/sulfonate/bicarbonate transport system ATPase subunit